MLIGPVKVKETTQTTYFSTHEQIQRAERVLVVPKGSGKTYKAMNLAINALEIGR
jgi:phosphate starvation-inducible protein PhoH